MLKKLIAALALFSAAASANETVELAVQGCFPLKFDFNNDARVSVLKHVPRDVCADIALYLNSHMFVTIQGVGCVLCKSPTSAFFLLYSPI